VEPRGRHGDRRSRAERLLEQLLDATLADMFGVDASGSFRYRLHDLLRDFARDASTALRFETPSEIALASSSMNTFVVLPNSAASLVHPSAPASVAIERKSAADPGRVRGSAAGPLRGSGTACRGVSLPMRAAILLTPSVNVNQACLEHS
jgi:hypothetical protein